MRIDLRILVIIHFLFYDNETYYHFRKRHLKTMNSFRPFVGSLLAAGFTFLIGAPSVFSQTFDNSTRLFDAPVEIPPPTETTENIGKAEENQDSTDEQDSDIEELQRQINLLADELERLRSGEPEIEITMEDARARGLAPSAAATYGVARGLSIGGYGEMLYENYSARNQGGSALNQGTKFDFLRNIIYVGYRFNDKFLFNSEIEVEHAKEIFVEFAYVDYMATDNFGLRAGMLLVPMGLVNEFHEPTVFLGAERPVTEQRIIPSTWRENGGGIYGSFDRVSFRAYVVNGFNGTKFSSKGVRGGRQKGGKAKANNMAFAGRLDVTPTPGVFFGASVYSGGSGQGQVVFDDVDYGITTTIFDLHAQAQLRGLDLRALFAQANLDDVTLLNQRLGLSGSKGIAKTMRGAYAQIGYDVLSQFSGNQGISLTPYVRYEQVDTQALMASGFGRSLSTDNTFTVVGVELKPISNIVVKVDHMWVTNDANSGLNQFNINIGYAF